MAQLIYDFSSSDYVADFLAHPIAGVTKAFAQHVMQHAIEQCAIIAEQDKDDEDALVVTPASILEHAETILRDRFEELQQLIISDLKNMKIKEKVVFEIDN